MLYLELDAIIETSNSNFTAAFTFSMIALSVIYPIQLVPITPLVAYFMNTNKHLEQCLPPPSRLTSFLVYRIV